jgi:hypothetical protein
MKKELEFFWSKLSQKEKYLAFFQKPTGVHSGNFSIADGGWLFR